MEQLLDDDKVLNLSALDELVADYVAHAKASRSEAAGPGSPLALMSKVGKLLKACLLLGDTALALQLHAEARHLSTTLQDPRVHFALKRQHFVELLRHKQDAAALEFLQSELSVFLRLERSTEAPDGAQAASAGCDLRADFDAALACAMYDGESDSCPTWWRSDWRELLANHIAARLQLEVGYEPPQLLLIAVMLAVVATRASKPAGGQQDEGLDGLADLVHLPELLSLAPLNQEGSQGSKPPPWRLVTASDILTLPGTREAAKATAAPALAQALLSVPHHPDVLDSAVLEYCGLRGMSAGHLASAPPPGRASGSDTHAHEAGGDPVKAPRKEGSVRGPAKETDTEKCERLANLVDVAMGELGEARAGEADADADMPGTWLDVVEQRILGDDILGAVEMVESRVALTDLSPELQFKVQQLRMLKLAAEGDLLGAQTVSSGSLGKLAQGHERLLPLLRNSMSMLMAASCSSSVPTECKVDACMHIRTHFSCLGRAGGAGAAKAGASGRLVAMLQAGLAAYRDCGALLGDAGDCGIRLDIGRLVAHGRRGGQGGAWDTKLAVGSGRANDEDDDEDGDEEMSSSVSLPSGVGEEVQNMQSAEQQLMAITNVPIEYARALLNVHEGDLAAAVAMVMDTT